MFGGFGIFVDGVMFGLIANDAIYFRPATPTARIT